MYINNIACHYLCRIFLKMCSKQIDNLVFLAMLMQSSATTVYWIGGNDRDTDSGWHWSDGSPFAFFYWQHGKKYTSFSKSN